MKTFHGLVTEGTGFGAQAAVSEGSFSKGQAGLRSTRSGARQSSADCGGKEAADGVPAPSWVGESPSPRRPHPLDS